MKTDVWEKELTTNQPCMYVLKNLCSGGVIHDLLQDFPKRAVISYISKFDISIAISIKIHIIFEIHIPVFPYTFPSIYPIYARHLSSWGQTSENSKTFDIFKMIMIFKLKRGEAKLEMIGGRYPSPCINPHRRGHKLSGSSSSNKMVVPPASQLYILLYYHPGSIYY